MNEETRSALQRVATPTAVGFQLGRKALGFQMQAPPHVLYVERKVVEAIVDPAQRFLLVTMPPRHGKSVTMARLTPLWYTGLFPDNQVIYATYSDDFSKRQGAWVRDIKKAYGPTLFGHGVSPTESASSAWRNDGYIGGMLSVGRGGAITGEPGHLIIGDDLIKNPEEANSTAMRKALLSWFDEVLRIRLEPGGTIILFFTRWRIDDLIGSLIERSETEGWTGDRWEVINLPALAEPPRGLELSEEELEEWRDVLGRKYGEALWSDRYPREVLLQLRMNNPETFQSMFQGDPRPSEGGWFNRTKWRYFDSTPDLRRTVRIWDLAASESDGDWTVGAKWGLGVDGNLYVLDVIRRRLSGNDVMDLVRDTARADGIATTVYIEQERAGAGKALLSIYKAKMRGFNVLPLQPKGDKESRAKPYNNEQSGGRVLLPVGADWLVKWIDEHESFGKTRHDDQVDSGSYAVELFLADGGGSMLTTVDEVLSRALREEARGPRVS